MNDTQHLKDRLDTQVARRRKAERERDTILSHTVFIGTLGLLLVLPVVAGAYAGLWLDRLAGGYSIRWTLSLIMAGVAVGAVNVYLFIRERS